MMADKGYDWRLGRKLPMLGRHSVAKHEIFDRYVEAYIRTLTRTPRQTDLRLTIVDGFCGGGLYDLGGEQVEGSPLRMLASVERIEAELAGQRSKGFTIHADYVFVDSNDDHIEFLRHVLRDRGHGDRIGRDIHIHTSKFEAVAGGIIDRIRAKGSAHRSLFFLDQYGWSDVTFSTMRRIMSSLNKPEIVLTFMVDNLVNLLNERMIDTRALAAIELGRDDVREMLDLKQNRGWKRLIQNTLYEHVKASTGASYYTPFFVHPDGGSNRDYWLLHLSKHHTARDEMGKIHWGMENTFEHFGRDGFNALGFEPGRDVVEGFTGFGFDDSARGRSEDAVVVQLAEMLHRRAVADQRPLTKQRLFAAHCNETPVISSIVDTSLDKMRQAHDVIIRSKDGALRRSVTEFEWSDEITMSKAPGLFSMIDKRAA